MVRWHKTGKTQWRKNPYEEGVAIHPGPESCVGAREGDGEALTGARAGRAIEPRNMISGTPTQSSDAEGEIRGVEKRDAAGSRAVCEPEHARKRLSREPGDPTLVRSRESRTAPGSYQAKPVEHERGKSDSLVVPVTSPNEAVSTVEEAKEGRRLAKGNPSEQNTHRTQRRAGVHSALERVRGAARRDRKQKFTSLYHHVHDIAHLRSAYEGIRRNAAAGVDGQTWQHYGQDLERNLQNLSERLQRGAFRARPARRVYIAKADGRQRPLGVPALEDKIVQRATVDVLNTIYETDFLGFSYGFRPGSSPHDALDALAVGVMKTKVSWVLDADIRGFFDALDHGWLAKFIEHRVADRRIVRLIQKWLNAGVLEDGVRTRSEMGTVQGGSISPLLANVYLHYVFDLWVQQWRKREAKGNVIVVRFADDFVVGFERHEDAKRFQQELRARLAEFKLELHPEKTRLIEFGKYAAENRGRRGEGKPETFSFLGFTHICAKTRQGYFSVVRQTMRDRQRAKLKAVKEEIRRRMHTTLEDQGRYLRSVVAGFIRYFGVPFNSRSIVDFRMEVAWHWWRAQKRRSQRHRMTWPRMKPHVDRWLPPARICQPQPLARFNVKNPKQEPDAGNRHVRICGGGQ